MDISCSLYSREMDSTHKVVDLSSCFLLEASGDSESDFAPNYSSKDLVDDDAQSCSCDVSDYFSRITDLNAGEVEQESVDDHKEVETQQDEQVHAYQDWANGLPVNQKSCVSVESTNESMTEIEKNRLFWETCLAS